MTCGLGVVGLENEVSGQYIPIPRGVTYRAGIIEHHGIEYRRRRVRVEVVRITVQHPSERIRERPKEPVHSNTQIRRDD